jgi:hypothetical protein
MLGHSVPNWRPTWVAKHSARNSQMLMGTENTMYKGKSLHVHSNNKNHILENRNGKHTYRFMTHLKKKLKIKKIKNTQIYGLTPRRQKPFFSKNI